MASRIKGITIEINGDTQGLQDSLKDVDSSLKTTQAKLKDVNKLLKYDPANVTLLKQKHDLLSKAVEDTKERQKRLVEALEQAKSAGSTEKAQEQQDALQRELQETTSKLENYQKQLDNCHPYLDAFSTKAGEVAEKTEKISAVAGGAVLGMVGMAYNAGTAADDLLTLANVTGFSVEELQKMQYASDFIDVSMETMTGSITKLTKNMESGNSAFETLGISVTNADGTMRDATEVWYETIAALGQVGNETERDQLSMDLFGKSAMEMAGIVDDGGASLKQLGEEAEATGNILSQDAVEDTVAFNDQIDEMKGKAVLAFQSAGAALAESLLPMLEELVDKVSEVLEWFGSLDGDTQMLILTVLGLVAAISPVAKLFSGISTVVGGLSAAFTFLCSPVGLAVAAIAGAIAIGVALYKNWDTIKQKASELWQKISDVFTNIKNTISEKIEAAKNTVKSAIDKIKSFFNFSWSLPALKLPHISMTGSFSLTPPSVPHFGIDWYSKAMDKGMILDGATIFGMMGNKLLAGGEAGPEAVIGTNSLYNMIQSAVGSKTVNAPINLSVTVNGNVDNSQEFTRDLAQNLAELITRESEVFA